jgi:EAL domain-containing protein (putative c-di-GMP-specific phosphodiesterase class I)
LQIGYQLFLRDLGSTHGTFLNRQQVTQPTPIADGDHIEIANVEFRVELRGCDLKADECEQKELNRTLHAQDMLEGDWVLSQFHELMLQRAVTPHYQPILGLNEKQVVGFEALARSPLIGLKSPLEMFRAAEMVNREVGLSLICRERALEFGTWIPLHHQLFVNTHSHENLDHDTLPSLASLQAAYPGRTLVLEIHEGVIHNHRQMTDFCKRVRDLGFKVAYDDFGAGQSRLLELVKSPPDYLKFDSCLIRDIHQSNAYQWRMLKMLVDMCHDVPVITIAEGLELQHEIDACRELGFELGQGFIFGHPQPSSFYESDDAE